MNDQLMEKVLRIQKFMNENKLTQEDMARKLNITRQYLNLMINGNKPISKKVAIELEKITDVSYNEWITEKEDKGSAVNLETDDKGDKIFPLLEDWKIYGYRTLVDFELRQAVEHGYIKIKNFNSKNVEPTSYSFSLGETFLLSSEEEPLSLKEFPELIIQPNQYIIVKTNEIITLPANIMGALSPTSTFADCHVQIHNGMKVHPGYNGIILFTIFNNTKNEISFDHSLKLLRIEFTFLPRRPQDLYSGDRQNMFDFPKLLIDLHKKKFAVNS